MYEKCKFLSMGYISALTQTSVLYEARMFLCDFKLPGIAKDTNNISHAVLKAKHKTKQA